MIIYHSEYPDILMVWMPKMYFVKIKFFQHLEVYIWHNWLM